MPRTIAVFFLLAFTAVPALTAELGVEPGEIRFTLDPGGRGRLFLTLRHDQSHPVVYKLYFGDSHFLSDGREDNLPPGMLSRSAAPFITPEAGFIEIAPGEARRVSIELNAPKGAAGSYWTKLYFREVGAAGGALEEDPFARVFVDVVGTLFRETSVEWLSTEVGDDRIAVLSALVENRGNTYARSLGIVELHRQECGCEPDTFPLGVYGEIFLYPGGSRKFVVSPETALEPGLYKASAVLDLGLGEFVRAITTFNVEKEAADPPLLAAEKEAAAPPPVVAEKEAAAPPPVVTEKEAAAPPPVVAEKEAADPSPAVAEKVSPPVPATAEGEMKAPVIVYVVEGTGDVTAPEEEAAERSAPPATEPETEPDPEPPVEVAASTEAAPENSLVGEEKKPEPVEAAVTVQAAVTVETAAQPESKAPSPPARQDAGGERTFRIQLAAVADAAGAEKFARSVRPSFEESVYVEHAPPYHKVLVGSALTMDQARLVHRKAKTLGYDDAWIAAQFVQVPVGDSAMLTPEEAPKSAAPAAAPEKAKEPGAYRVRLHSAETEAEAKDYAEAVRTVFEDPLLVEPAEEGYSVYVGISLSEPDANRILDRAKMFGFDEAVIEDLAPAAKQE